jgi:hypothetical protein
METMAQCRVLRIVQELAAVLGMENSPSTGMEHRACRRRTILRLDVEMRLGILLPADARPLERAGTVVGLVFHLRRLLLRRQLLPLHLLDLVVQRYLQGGLSE